MKQTHPTTRRSSDESKTGAVGGVTAPSTVPASAQTGVVGKTLDESVDTVDRIHGGCPADKAIDFAGQDVFYCPVCKVQIWPREGQDVGARLVAERDPYCVVRRQAAQAKKR